MKWLGFSAIAALFSFQAHAAVMLVHTNDILGELEPCGCRSNPLGGVVREMNLLKKKIDAGPRITLDSGDLLFPTDTVPEALIGQSKLQAGYLLKAMELMGYDAVTPGEKDFALGLKAFEELTRHSKLHFLAANLKPKKGHNPFTNHLILTRKQEDGRELKVAVFGVVGRDLHWNKDLTVSDPFSAAKKEVAALRKKADLVIALSHLGLEDDKKLAEANLGIDIIVGAHTQAFLQTPILVNHAWLYQSSFRNQYVGIVPLVKNFANENYELIGLDPGYDSPAEAPTAMDSLVKEFKVGVATLNSQQDAERESKFKVAHSEEPIPGKKLAEHFQTFPRCAECHLKQFDFWRKTAHAGALTPLIEKDQFKNKECLSCHTVGMGKPGAFTNVNTIASIKTGENDETKPLSAQDFAQYLKAMHGASSLKANVKLASDGSDVSLEKSLSQIAYAWTPVQCENCHLPGGDHPFTAGYTKKVEKTVCLSCHTAERAPEWFTKDGKPNLELIEAKRKSITCPSGDLSDDEAP